MNEKTYFENEGFKLIQGNCLDILPTLKPASISTIFADPPYKLSSGGITCKGGKAVCVNKAEWDKPKSLEEDFKFTYGWLKLCRDVLRDDGSIWISGTHHNIYQVGFALQQLGFQIMNEIIWFKPNASPNLSCRYFTHSHETILWAKKEKIAKHHFDYPTMKQWQDPISPSGKQMRSVWSIPLTAQHEKKHGFHPTQKPLELLKRIVAASTKPEDYVLDPFNGSGTTGIAAHLLKRRYIGIDMEKNYLDITLKRYKAVSNQKTLSL